MNIEFREADINAELFDQEIREALPTCYGISYSDGALTVLLADPEGTTQEIETERRAATGIAAEVLAAHDPARKSARQQEQEVIEAQREEFLAAPLDVETFNRDALLRQLAERVAWLERELARLVG